MIETTGGDSIVSLFGVTFTPKYFAICPDKSMKGFNPGFEDNIMIFINSCGAVTDLHEYENKISATYVNGHIFLLSKFKTKYRINVTNLVGQSISTQFYYAENGMNNINLDLGKGFYIITIQSEKEDLYTFIKVLVE